MEFNNEYALLQEIYKGAAMGQDSIRLLLPKVTNARFRSDLQSQYEQYRNTAKEAEKKLKHLGYCPKELTTDQKTMLRMGMFCKTAMNTETSHLAELMIEGSNMGIISLTKALNAYGDPKDNPAQSETESQNARPPMNPAAALARTTIQNEENNISRLKIYLQ